MKKTARFLVALLVVLMSLALFSGQALASTYDHCASALQAMGLFKGSTTGFELDRQATCAEGAVMLVRLLGAEEEALKGSYSHPFKDVPAWASPHIAYMYEKGLTKGTSATTFTPQGICDLKMFSTFILRALGYSEAAGDFTYATAADFAWELGLVDLFTGSGAFLRDNMAAISYTALFAPTKGADSTLLAQLIEQGAVAENAAQPYLTLFADYALMREFSTPDIQTGEPLEIKFNLTMNMDMGAEGKADVKYDALLQLDASAVGEIESLADVLAALEKIKVGMTNQAAVSGGPPDEKVDMDVKLNLYLLDGVLYLDTNLGAVAELPVPEKMKLDLAVLTDMLGLDDVDLDELDLMDMYSEMMANIPIPDMAENIASLLPADPYSGYYGIAMVKSIKSTETAGGKRIDVTMIDMANNFFQDMAALLYSGMDEVLDVMEEMNISMSNLLYSYYLDKNNVMTGLKVDMKMNQTMFAGTEDEAVIKSTLQFEFHITKTGADVKITLPGKAEDYADVLEMLENMGIELGDLGILL